ncbi:MAG: alpha/beta fold hydrolase [Pseudomonadota bacterium]
MKLATYQADLDLVSGETLTGARLVYAVWGQLNAARDNLILFPTRFGGGHEQNAFLVGEDMALDPRKYCIVTPNMLGNGVSSSPSNTAGAAGGSGFPVISHRDNIAFQRAMLAEVFGAPDIALAVGWSMGAQQACRWAVEEPARVRRLLMICGTARTTPHNRVFLESILAALAADPEFGGPRAPLGGLRAVGRIYAGWAYSQPWIKRGGHRVLGFETVDDWLTDYWDALFKARNADDIVAMVRTWIGADVADGGVLGAALARVTAKTLVTTARTDLYFTPEDCAADAALIPGAAYRDIDTDWGHMCGAGQSPADTAVIDGMIREMLAEPA